MSIHEITLKAQEKLRFFCYRKINFIYKQSKKKFQKADLDVYKSYKDFRKEFNSHDITNEIRGFRQLIYGKNNLNIEVKNALVLLFTEVLNPFYLFQLFSVVVWMVELYWIYSISILVTSSLAALLELYETRKNLLNLAEMARIKPNMVKKKDGKFISTEELVPGDIIEIPPHFAAPCDIVILSGTCIVNESMLTGESTPVLKTPLPDDQNDKYIVDEHKNYTLYAGTEVVLTKSLTTGLVCRTGFNTSKGRLVLSILYPKPNSFSFYSDSIKFIFVMFLLGCIGMIYSCVMLIRAGAKPFIIVTRVLDVITIAVPPALPIAMTVGTSYALWRLKNNKIYCISPPRVNVSGMLKLVCFDKTGTLTEEGLSLLGVKPSYKKRFQSPIQSFNVSRDLQDKKYQPLLYGLASCHSLALLKMVTIGDPLEQKVFEATNWKISDQDHDDTIITSPFGEEIRILKRFDFSSSLQRMSSISTDKLKTFIFTKGSPEMIKKLSVINSIPDDYDSIQNYYTKKGFRVLSIGYRDLTEKEIENPRAITRDDAEKDLTFLGFIVMQNRLKPTTPPVIQTLEKGNIKSVMITGDNAFTAVTVGKESGILPKDIPIYLGDIDDSTGKFVWNEIDSDGQLDPLTLKPYDQKPDFLLAITGKAFQEYVKNHSKTNPNPSFLKILLKCLVFARMSPDQKMRLIEEYQNIGKYTCMCGDGANDIAALKAAHVGVSLSEAEASIAAPFTSLEPTIECIPIVIKEGRSSLVTSFSLFKYMAIYSFFQFITVMSLYSLNANLSDSQFLYVDMFVIIPVVLLMGGTEANDELVKERPNSQLFSFPVFASVFGQLLIGIVFQLLALFDLRSQSWYLPAISRNGDPILFSYDGTVMFLMNQFLTLNMALVYSQGYPFKKPIYTNILFTVVLVFLYFCSSFMMISPFDIVRRWFSVIDMNALFKLKLLGYCYLHLVVASFYEYIVYGMSNHLPCQYKRKTAYRTIKNEYLMK